MGFLRGETVMKCGIAMVLLIAVVLVPSVASAIDPPDGNGPSVQYGTPGDDVMRGGRGPDVMYGLAGDDIIWTGKGGPGDKAYGGRGADRLNNWGSGNAPGLLNGGPGYDVCKGDEHDTFKNCEKIAFK